MKFDLSSLLATGGIVLCLVAAVIPGCGGRVIPPQRDVRIEMSLPAASRATPAAASASPTTAAVSPSGEPSIPVVPVDSVMQWHDRTAEAVYHEVRDGETLSAIARQYGASTGRLKSVNGLDDADAILPGQLLLIPSQAR